MFPLIPDRAVLAYPAPRVLRLLVVTLFAYRVCFCVAVGAECISNSISFGKAMQLHFQQERASCFFSLLMSQDQKADLASVR